MSRKSKPAPATGGIPAWFMTYSDVITLLMTFFILLLTFATNEPEKFAQMQAVTFGGGRNASGLVGGKDDSMDKDTLVIRSRPSAARVGSEGSETPPTYTDPVRESLEKGIMSLDDENPLAESSAFSIDIPWSLLFESNGQPTSYGQQRLRMIALQMKRLPLQLRMGVPTAADLASAVRVADEISRSEKIAAGRISIGTRPGKPGGDRTLRLSMSWGLPDATPVNPDKAER